MNGRVNNIQKYSVNDGGGIRTVVFLQGCPLRCRWCANPETKTGEPQRIFWKNKCIGCGRCAAACPRGWGNRELSKLCDGCMKCVDACYAHALCSVFREYSVAEVVKQAMRDQVHYRMSGGGVTLSGGEPLVQWEFAAAVLEELQSLYIDTAIETSGFACYDHLIAAARNCNRILYDIKHMDEAMHKEYTGVSNRLILDNLARLTGEGIPVIIRVPLIHEVNDSEEHIMQVADFAQEHGIREIHLLPFHRLGESKYAAIGLINSMPDATVPDEHVKYLKAKLKARDITVLIGG